MEKDGRLISFTFIVFFVLSLIMPLEQITSGPFQKVVIAPIGEEAFKFLWAFLFFYFIIISKQKRKISVDYIHLFSHTFVYFSIITGILFGTMEYAGGLSMGNIFSHFSFSAIGAVLIVFWFVRVKYPYKNTGFMLIGISMFLHSVSNQYANLTSVTKENSYLVSVADFLKNNTPLVSQWDYTRVIYYTALVFVVMYFWIYTRPQIIKKLRNNK